MTDFDTFWSLYPRKKGRGVAEKAWDKAVKVASPEEIIAGLKANLADLKNVSDAKYIPHGSTWLNNKRWEDEPDEQPVPNVGIPNYRQSEETVQRAIELVQARKNAANGR